MKSERTSLFQLFYATLIPLYSSEMTMKLAEAHCEAHQQFLREMYLDGTRRNKVLKNGKPSGALRKNRSKLVQGVKKIVHKSKNIVERSPSANMQDVKREVLSVMQGWDTPERLVTVFEALRNNAFGWSFSQVKRAVRELREEGFVEQSGNKRSAKYKAVARVGSSGSLADVHTSNDI